MPLSQDPSTQVIRGHSGVMNSSPTTGRVAVITGASSGIGEATARALAANGYRVALLARRADRIQALADELGDGAIAIAADVTDRDSLVAAAPRVREELGGADVLINNAGVMLLAPFRPPRQRRVRRDEVGPERLVGVAAPGASSVRGETVRSARADVDAWLRRTGLVGARE